MHINELQKNVHEFEKEQNWIDQDIFYAFTLLTEEIGELGREIRRMEVGRFGHNEEMTKEEIRKEIEKEIGDVLFALSKIANVYEVKFGEAHEVQMQKMRDRLNSKNNNQKEIDLDEDSLWI